MDISERVRKLEEEYKPIPFNDYRNKLDLLRPYFKLSARNFEYDDSKKGHVVESPEECRTNSILFEIYRFEKFEKAYLHLLKYVQGKEKIFPRAFIWDMGTNLLPNYVNNFAIPDGKFRNNFPEQIKQNFSDLLHHRLDPKGGQIRRRYFFKGNPKPQHMYKIIELMGDSLNLFRDYISLLIDQSSARLHD